MTAPPAGALEACLALLEKAKFGELSVSGAGFLLEDRHMLGHGVYGEAAPAIAAAVNLLKDHGPALLAALRLREWRPIAEAPKDLQIIGWSPQYGARETRWTLYGEGSPAKAAFDRDEGPEGYWDWSEPIHNWGSSWNPTHWCPLSPPTADDLARVLRDGE